MAVETTHSMASQCMHPCPPHLRTHTCTCTGRALRATQAQLEVARRQITQVEQDAEAVAQVAEQTQAALLTAQQEIVAQVSRTTRHIVLFTVDDLQARGWWAQSKPMHDSS
jgi:hypothetical protein